MFSFSSGYRLRRKKKITRKVFVVVIRAIGQSSSQKQNSPAQSDDIRVRMQAEDFSTAITSIIDILT